MSLVLPAMEEPIRTVKNVEMVGRKTKKEHASVRKFPMAIVNPWFMKICYFFNAWKTHGTLIFIYSFIYYLYILI